jgi:hypothetical protein
MPQQLQAVVGIACENLYVRIALYRSSQVHKFPVDAYGHSIASQTFAYAHRNLSSADCGLILPLGAVW